MIASVWVLKTSHQCHLIHMKTIDSLGKSEETKQLMRD